MGKALRTCQIKGEQEGIPGINTAEHIYDNMAEVSGYLDGEGKIDLNKADRAATGKRRRVMTTQKYAGRNGS